MTDLNLLIRDNQYVHYRPHAEEASHGKARIPTTLHNLLVFVEILRLLIPYMFWPFIFYINPGGYEVENGGGGGGGVRIWVRFVVGLEVGVEVDLAMEPGAHKWGKFVPPTTRNAHKLQV